MLLRLLPRHESGSGCPARRQRENPRAQHVRGGFESLLRNGNSVEASDGVRLWNQGAPLRLGFSYSVAPNNFGLQTVWIGRGQHLFIEQLSRTLDRSSCSTKPPFPKTQRLLRNTKRGQCNLSHARATASCHRPREERKNGAGSSIIIAEIEMVRPRVVEADGPFYQPQSKQFRVKI